MNYFELEPEKVWQFTTSWSKEKKKEAFDKALDSDMYLASIKQDGHWHRFVKQGSESKIQSRGISTITGKYGEHQEHLPHIYGFLSEICVEDTVLLGEMYLKGKKDRDVTKILGCLPEKAVLRQKDEKVLFYIFDVLVWRGKELFDTQFEDRVKIMKDEVAPLMSDNKYIEVAEFFEGEEIRKQLEVVLEAGGEGIVMMRKDALPQEGARTARKTIKIKAELGDDVDAFFTGSFVPGTRNYQGGEIETWDYWQNLKTGELVRGQLFSEYTDGVPLEPVTRNYFYNRPASLEVGVYKSDGSIFSLGYVSGLTDELKDQFVKDKASVSMKPVLISAMEFTEDKQLRHPRFKGFKPQANIEDCTYNKVFDE